MNIIYCKNNCEFLNNINKYKYQGLSGSGIYIYNNKLLVKKINNKDDSEIKNINLIINLTKKSQFKIFFAQHFKLYIYKNYNYIFMKRYIDTVRFIHYKSIEEFKNIVQQILLASLYKNYILGLYHNDFHLDNILYKNIDNIIDINFYGIKLKIKDKLIKIIDFDSLGKEFTSCIQNGHPFQICSNAKRYLKNSKNENIIYNEFIIALLFFLIKSKIKNNKVIVFDIKRGMLYDDFVSSYEKIYNFIQSHKIKNKFEDYIRFYNYIDNNFIEFFTPLHI